MVRERVLQLYAKAFKTMNTKILQVKASYMG